MFYITCPHCRAELTVYENDTMPECREMEEVFCPCCGKQADAVFTSGIPSVEVRTLGNTT